MRKKIMISIFILLAGCAIFSFTPVNEGKTIFSSRCASCHNVNKVVVGPALAGVTDRHSEEWIIKFVHSSQSVIIGGDTAAVRLYEKFNKIPMPDHPDLTAENIQGILAYIKSETKAFVPDPSFRPEKVHPKYTPITNLNFFAAYLGLVILMAVSFVALVKVKEIQRNKMDDTVNN
jgi:cytochrome c551/c552